jgi:hypothetical protein
MGTIHERILRAIEPLGKTEEERARAVKFTVRTLDNWAKGEGLKTLERLEEAGIIHIAGECSCSRKEQATA